MPFFYYPYNFFTGAVVVSIALAIIHEVKTPELTQLSEYTSLTIYLVISILHVTLGV